MSSRVRTFLDADVLIVAWRGDRPHSLDALAILNDPVRAFVSSDFVMLETIPQATYNRRRNEVGFYEDYFNAVPHWVQQSRRLTNQAFDLASRYGLTAVDALHIAAAVAASADEFITAERPTSPLSRVRELRVSTIYQS
jgi:predicted nucleic acid-binding protein